MGENWDFSGFFSDFGGESLLVGQKWGLVCQLAGLGRNRQEKCVKKRLKMSVNWHKIGVNS